MNAPSLPPPVEDVQSASEITEARGRRLTARQRICLEFIERSIAERGYPPTLREIGAHMGIRSTNGVNDHLRALERKGALRKADTKSRGLTVLVRSDRIPETAIAVDFWRAENTALRRLLERAHGAMRRMPGLTPEAVVVLGDIRDAISAPSPGREDR